MLVNFALLDLNFHVICEIFLRFLKPWFFVYYCPLALSKDIDINEFNLLSYRAGL